MSVQRGAGRFAGSPHKGNGDWKRSDSRRDNEGVASGAKIGALDKRASGDWKDESNALGVDTVSKRGSARRINYATQNRLTVRVVSILAGTSADALLEIWDRSCSTGTYVPAPSRSPR